MHGLLKLLCYAIGMELRCKLKIPSTYFKVEKANRKSLLLPSQALACWVMMG